MCVWVFVGTADLVFTFLLMCMAIRPTPSVGMRSVLVDRALHLGLSACVFVCFGCGAVEFGFICARLGANPAASEKHRASVEPF